MKPLYGWYVILMLFLFYVSYDMILILNNFFLIKKTFFLFSFICNLNGTQTFWRSSLEHTMDDGNRRLFDFDWLLCMLRYKINLSIDTYFHCLFSILLALTFFISSLLLLLARWPSYKISWNTNNCAYIGME